MVYARLNTVPPSPFLSLRSLSSLSLCLLVSSSMCRSALPISLSAGAGPNRIICNRKWAKVSLGQRGWPKRDVARRGEFANGKNKFVCNVSWHCCYCCCSCICCCCCCCFAPTSHRPHSLDRHELWQGSCKGHLPHIVAATCCRCCCNLLLQQWRPLTPFSCNVNEIKANYA